MAGIGQARMYEIQQQNIQAFKSKIASGQINKDSTFVIKRYDKISDTVANILLAKGITNPTTEQIQEVKSQLLNNSDISGTIKAKNKGDMDLYFLKEGKSIDMSKIHVTGEIDQKALNELQDQLEQSQSNQESLTEVSKPVISQEVLQPSEEQSPTLQNDISKSQNEIFKNQISNMSKKQLKQFAENSNDLNKLKMISEELGSRGKDHSKSIVDKKINLLEEQQNKSQQARVETSVQQQPDTETPQKQGVLNGQADVESAVVKPEQAVSVTPAIETQVASTPVAENRANGVESNNDISTKEQVQDKIKNLASGESYTYHTVNSSLENINGQLNTVKYTTQYVWTKNDDGNLILSTQGEDEYVTTKEFNSDGVIKKQTYNTLPVDWRRENDLLGKVTTTEDYSPDKHTYNTTIKFSEGMNLYKSGISPGLLRSDQHFQTFKDSNGNIIMTSDGENFKDKNGNIISYDDAKNKLFSNISQIEYSDWYDVNYHNRSSTVENNITK